MIIGQRTANIPKTIKTDNNTLQVYINSRFQKDNSFARTSATFILSLINCLSSIINILNDFYFFVK